MTKYMLIGNFTGKKRATICDSQEYNLGIIYFSFSFFLKKKNPLLHKYRSKLEPSYRYAISESTTIEIDSLYWYQIYTQVATNNFFDPFPG
uniref:Putative ovule protein n=1 Tax=Solanum chacoense TaxID=4108 RepID=A0A0V0GXI6_SOLCH